MRSVRRRISGQGSSSTVSYTHLDVYKRQVQLRFLENFYETRELIYRFLVGAQFLAIEVGNVDNAFQVVANG